MSIKICGASGFIGQHLLTNLPDAISISLRSEEWKNDMRDDSVMINLVGKAHDHRNEASEQDYYYANLTLAQEVFKAFTQSASHLLIHISSIAAVEEFESESPLEETQTSNAISWYGKSKYDAEKWLMAQKLPAGKKLIILRPPMVHGAGDKGNLKLLYKIISKGIPYPLAVFKNQRSFICIQNFVYFINQIVEKYDRMGSGIYHIADDESISTTEIIELIQQVTEKKPLSLPLPKPFVRMIAKIGDVIPIPINTKRLKKMTSTMLVSNQKIKIALGIEKLPVTAQEGMMETLRSFK